MWKIKIILEIIKWTQIYTAFWFYLWSTHECFWLLHGFKNLSVLVHVRCWSSIRESEVNWTLVPFIPQNRNTFCPTCGMVYASEKKIFLSAPTQLHLTFFIYVALEIWDELSWFSVVVCSMLELTSPWLQTALGWNKGFHIRSHIVLHRFLKLYRKVLVAGVAYFRIPSDFKDIF